MKKDFALGCVFIGLATLIFSTMEVMLKLPAVAGAFHPMQILMERFLIGGTCLIPVAAWTLKKRGVRLSLRDIRAFALTGFVNVILGMICYQMALGFGQANVVAVVFSSNPIFTTVLAFLILRETIRWNNLAALALEVVGILAIVDPFGSGDLSLISIGLAVLSALFFSLYVVLGKRKTKQVGSIVVTCASLLCGALELLVLLLLGHTAVGHAIYEGVHMSVLCDVPFFQGINSTTLPYFLFIGMINCAAGYVCHMLAVEKTSAIYGSLVFFFKPILAPLIALAALGEAISAPIAHGIVFFLIGSLVSIVPDALRARRAAQKPPAETPTP